MTRQRKAYQARWEVPAGLNGVVFGKVMPPTDTSGGIKPSNASNTHTRKGTKGARHE